MIAKCLFSKKAHLEVKKWEEESNKSVEICTCEICDPEVCPCLKSIFISEYGKNCGCKKCPSKAMRVGRTIPVMLFRTQKCGWSIRTMANIAKHRHVMEYVGVIKTYEECEQINNQTYLCNCDLPDSTVKFDVDGTKYGNESRFINYHCDPNLDAFSVFGYCSNPSLPRVVFY
uniref:SET domain-containing protein n=1 Tax=Panagrolaimus superbus TaxID=310955 RepID=A0A914YET1_9BILA